MNLRLSAIVAAIAVMAASALPSRAQTIIDTGVPAHFMTIGARIGFNTANISSDIREFNSRYNWNHTTWGKGFVGGAVVDLNFRNFFAIETGLTFRYRASEYRYLNNNGTLAAIEGSWGCKYLEIPVLASFRFGVVEVGQLHIDFGPYFATGFGGHNKFTSFTADPVVPGDIVVAKGKSDFFGENGLMHRYDWGFHIGAGVLVLQHYYIGTYYNAGCHNIFRGNGQVHNKSWTFAIGYNF